MNAQREEELYDIIVIGGGISGLGVALEAAARGLRTLLLEKDLCCRATSNNSLRIIHGGFRYLQSLDFGRVMESARAQSTLLLKEAGFVKPLRCVMPLQRLGLRSKLPVRAALALYRLLSGRAARQYWRGEVLSSDSIDNEIPILSGRAPHGALLWTDAYLPDPSMFAERIKSSALEVGAEIRERTRVLQITRRDGCFAVLGETPAGEVCLAGRVVVNATGPWLTNIAPDKGQRNGSTPKWCKGFNVVLRHKLEDRYAIGVEAPVGRLFFLVPRGDKTAVGTWYEPFGGKPEEAVVQESELERFISELNKALPNASISVDDIEQVEVGILPMKEEGSQGPILYGAEKIRADNGYIEVMSTKYTTFLSQAQKVVREAESFLRKSHA